MKVLYRCPKCRKLYTHDEPDSVKVAAARIARLAVSQMPTAPWWHDATIPTKGPYDTWWDKIRYTSGPMLGAKRCS